MYSSWKDVPIPQRLASRPRDARGYPIPATVLIDNNGKPDFRITDAQRWMSAYKNRTCALCGEPMGRHLAFIGGPLTHENRYFTDLPLHLECAEYALKVCPFLAVPGFKYSENLAPDTDLVVRQTDIVGGTQPEEFMLGITKSCQAHGTSDGSVVVHAAPWEQVSWWRHGQCIEPLKAVSR